MRDRILDAAVQLLRTSGVKALTQPQVAKAAGVLQSHLTYYFPKRTDLLLAVARHSAMHVGQELQAFFATQAFPTAPPDDQERVLALLRTMVKDRSRTRMVLGLLVEADDDPALKAVIIEQVGLLRGLVALGLRRQLDDPTVDVVLATLWGLGLQHLLLAEKRGEAYTDAIVAQFPSWLGALPPPPEKPAATEKPAARKKR